MVIIFCNSLFELNYISANLFIFFIFYFLQPTVQNPKIFYHTIVLALRDRINSKTSFIQVPSLWSVQYCQLQYVQYYNIQTLCGLKNVIAHQFLHPSPTTATLPSVSNPLCCIWALTWCCQSCVQAVCHPPARSIWI